MKHILLSLFSLILFSFSGYSVLRATQEAAYPGTPVPVTQLGPKRSGPRVSFMHYSGFWDPLRMVIRNRETWREVWKWIHMPDPYRGPISELPPLPEIDFSREMIFVAALGGRQTGGYSIIVEGAYERGNRLELVVRAQSPGPSCIVTQAGTQPVDIVRFPKTERSVVFRETEVVHECK